MTDYAATRHPLLFARSVDSMFVVPKHVEYLSNVYTDMIAGRGPRFRIVSLPVRMGKSHFLSMLAPAWYLGRKPKDTLILGSYGAKFAASWGRKVRDILIKHGRQFNIGIDPNKHATDEWVIDGHGGGMITAGVGSGITGRGGQFLQLDDPVKDAEAALSPTQRDNLWEWFQSTFYTRREPGAPILIIMTRWHRDDLAGRLMSPETNPDGHHLWDYVRLPMIAEDNDPLGREPGDLLWPERFNEAEIANARAFMRNAWFQALYQQNPTEDVDGALWSTALIEASQQYVYPDLTIRILSIDPSIDSKSTSDEVGMIILGRDERGIVYVEDDFSGRMAPDEWAILAVRLYYEHNLNYIVIEDNQGGKMCELSIRNVPGGEYIPIVTVHATDSKLLRAEPIQVLYRVHRVKHTRQLDPLEAEMTSWVPGVSKSPNRIDAMVHGVTDLAQSFNASAFRDPTILGGG